MLQQILNRETYPHREALRGYLDTIYKDKNTYPKPERPIRAVQSQEYQDYERVCRHSQQGKLKNPDLYCFYYHGAKPNTQFTYGPGLHIAQ